MHTVTVSRPPAPPARRLAPLERVTGHAGDWSRDLALVGGVTGATAPAFMVFDPLYCLIAGIVGAVSGAALGLVLWRGLDAVRGVVPIPLLLLAVPLVGLGWGGLSGSVAGLIAAPVGTPEDSAGLGLGFGAVAAVLQLGWLWFPYTVQSVRRGWRWPLLLLACLVAPTLGWASFVTTLTLPLWGPLLPFAVGTVWALLYVLSREAGRRAPA